MPARKEPPAGYCNASQADEILGNHMLYRYVEKGLIKQYGPSTRKQKFYKISELIAVRNAEAAFFEEGVEHPTVQHQHEDEHNLSMKFAVATPEDMDALYEMAKKLFPKTADADRRRSWLAKEPRGHFIVKTNDGVVLAYLYLFPLVASQLVPYLRGELPSRQINPSDIEGFIPSQETSACVLGGIGSNPDYSQATRSNATKLLIRGVKQELVSWGREGIIIPKLYAFSETKDGIVMCCRLGMTQWEPPRKRWCTFQIDLEHMPSLLFADYQFALEDWKKTHSEKDDGTENNDKHMREQPTTLVPDELPEGTIALSDWIKQYSDVNQHRRKILSYLNVKSNGLSHLAIPSSRPGEMNRYLTPEQQEALFQWIKAHHPAILQPDV